MVLSFFSVQEKLKEQLQLRGAKGIEGLSAALHSLDPQGYLDRDGFYQFLSIADVGLKNEEIDRLFNEYGTEEAIDFQSLLIGVRGKLNEFREKLVISTFQELDQEREGRITIDTIRRRYNAKCHASVMSRRKTEEEVLDGFLATSFGTLQEVTPLEFLEYYALLSSAIRKDSDFELVCLKSWKACPDGFCVDEAENKVKLVVFKNRIRLREFFVDFDKLRCGYITETQLMSGLSTAGIKLTGREMRAIADKYKDPDDGQRRTSYRAFCDEVDRVFTDKELERAPLKDVPQTPDLSGLVPERFAKGSTYLGIEKEQKLEALLLKLCQLCEIKRILVKPFFDDAARNVNSTKRVGHVTVQQFKQALNSKIGLRLREDEMNLLVEKYDDNMDGMINYIAFAAEIDPPPSKYDPYRE